jgi:hypothetical protein
MNWWQSALISLGVGIASGFMSAKISIAVLTNDVSWIKREMGGIYKRLERLENKL